KFREFGRDDGRTESECDCCPWKDAHEEQYVEYDAACAVCEPVAEYDARRFGYSHHRAFLHVDDVCHRRCRHDENGEHLETPYIHGIGIAQRSASAEPGATPSGGLSATPVHCTMPVLMIVEPSPIAISSDAYSNSVNYGFSSGAPSTTLPYLEKDR